MKPVFFLLLPLCAVAQPRYVTLSLSTNRASATLIVRSNETAEVVSTPTSNNGSGFQLWVTNADWHCQFDGTRFQPGFTTYQPRTVICGPASLTLVPWPAPVPAYNPPWITVSITPETFPPGQTLIIPADTRGAQIQMQASADLVHWTNAPPGLYTNTTSQLFFRLRAERLP